MWNSVRIGQEIGRGIHPKVNALNCAGITPVSIVVSLHPRSRREGTLFSWYSATNHATTDAAVAAS